MIFVYSLGVSAHYLSAGLSGSIKRTTGGADRVSVAKTPPCSWIPKPVSGSPLRTTSLVSTWKTCPPGPTELDARDTEGERGRDISEGDISGNVAYKWSKRGIVGDKKWRRVRGRDMHPQRWNGSGKGVSHLSVFTSVMFTSGISQIFSHTESESKRKERCSNSAEKHFKGTVHPHCNKKISLKPSWYLAL